MSDKGHVTGEPRNDVTGGSYKRKNFIQRNKLDSPAFGCLCCCCIVLGLICITTITLLVLIQTKTTSEISTKLGDPGSPQAYFRMSTKDEKASNVTFRLSPDVKPLHYDLYLYPDLVKGTFSGNVTIRIDVLQKRNYIALHQKDLNITKAKLKTFDREENYELAIKETYTVEKFEELVVTFNEDIHSGMFELSFEFEGALQPDKIVGFYASHYKDEDNQTRTIATSKFEPTYARRGFPCFDEPSFKASFSVKLVHPTGDCYGALSNMNIESTLVDQPSKGLTTVNFAKSVPMSTYLACFIVTDFVAVTKPAKKLDESETYPISVYAPRAQKEKAQFPLEIGVQIIEYYTKLFKIDYPLPKLDMAAIPDFVSGAMENWGLITFREARLLYDKNTSSTADKEGIVQVIAHEFAHMWFGNLVTMGWWHDLWLNEGFATYMQYKSANACLPDWGIMERFLPDTLHSVFITDAKLSSHPIVQTVTNPDEITAIFDVITYSKGASVLRMLENFVGADTFIGGVTTYLNEFAYGNAETADLFRILQSATGSNINITAIMDTWTRQMGFPVVNVQRNGSNYILTQKRFLADPDAEYDPSESDYGYKWIIPMTYITDKNDKPTLVWFDKDAAKLEIKLDEPVEWVKFNHEQVGYYRVNYQKDEWEGFVDVLQGRHKRLSVADRTSLLEDAFSLAHATQLDYTVALKMTSYLNKEQSATPWRVAAAKLKDIDTLLLSTEILPKYREYIRELVDTPYHDVTWTVSEIEDHDTRRLRTSILRLACGVGHTECLDDAGAMFNKWIRDPKASRPHPDIKSAVYYYGMSHVGKEAEWNLMFQRFSDETDPNEKLDLLHGLAGVQSTWLLNKFIGIAVDERYVRSQDTFGCLQAIARNPVGTPLVWDWVRENWTVLVKRYTLNDRYLGQLIPGITSSFATQAKLQEMKAFFEKYPEAGAGKAYRARALETVSNNIKWIQMNSDKIDKWLDSRKI